MPGGMPGREPTAPSTAIEVTVITVTWRGAVPIDFSMPRPRRRSWALRTAVSKTPREAARAGISVSTVAEPTTVRVMVFGPLS
jgi:hypothetical protein